MRLTTHPPALPTPPPPPPKPTYTLELTHAQLVRLGQLSYQHEAIKGGHPRLPSTFYGNLPVDIQGQVRRADVNLAAAPSSPWADEPLVGQTIPPPRIVDQAVAGGPWTRHGHAIEGIAVAGAGRPPVARCGGPGLCGQCGLDAEWLRQVTPTTSTSSDSGPPRDPIHKQ